MKRFLAAVLSLCLFISLCACDSADAAKEAADAELDAASAAARASSEAEAERASEPEPEPEPDPDTVFAPLSPVREEALTEAIAWAEEEAARLKVLEEPGHSLYAEAFAEANNDYKSEYFVMAEEAYREILAENPFHPGALNNLVLALLQLEEHEEALRYSLLSGVLHPDFHAGRINLLVALQALGYQFEEAYAQIEEADFGYPGIDSFVQAFVEGGADPEEDPLFRSWLYNTIYGDMEQEMQELSDPEQREQDGLRLAAGEVTEEELAAEHMAWWMDNWEESLETFAEANGEDTDYTELLEYLRGLRTLRERQEAH